MELLLAVLAWWLALTVIGWSAMPLAWRLLPSLPDRGMALARPLGLLVAGFIYWAGVTMGAVPNTRLGAAFVVLALAALGAWTAARCWRELVDFISRKRALVWGYEWLFFVALAGWALYRAHYPNIETAGGEKYMEMAFVDSVLRSPRFPPLDPWLSGFAISYYYFGYVLAGLLIKLTGLVPFEAFNLVVPTSFALTLLGAFGIGYNLVALSSPSSRSERIAGGALTGSVLALAGSLEGALEFAYIRGWRLPLPPAPVAAIYNRLLAGMPSEGLRTTLASGVRRVLDATGPWADNVYDWLDIKNLTLAAHACGDEAVGFGAGGWVPHRFIWWWRASRVIHDNCGEVIHEFPFFSFMLGDAHPHVVALPFALLVLGLALAVLSGSFAPTDERRLWSPRWLAVPFVAGALGFLNAWDLPTYALVLAIAYGLRVAVGRVPDVHLGWGEAGLLAAAGAGTGWLAWRVAPRVLSVALSMPADEVTRLQSVAVAAVALAALYAAAYALWASATGGNAFSRRAVEIIRFAVWLGVLAVLFYLPFHVGFRSQASGIGWVAVRTRLPQWLVHFGLPFFLGASVIAVGLRGLRGRWRSLSTATLTVLALWLPVAFVTLRWRAWTAFVLELCVAAALSAAFERWNLGTERVYGRVAGGSPDAAGEQGGGAPAPVRGGDTHGPRAGGDGLSGGDSSAAQNRLPVAETFALVCIAVGLLMTLGTEFVFIRDLFGSRMNSVFKLYYQTWVLLSIGGGYMVYLASRRMSRSAAAVWVVPAVALVLASSAYPLMATYSRTRRPPGTPLSLNGLAWWSNTYPDDLAAVSWLRENVRGTPVILEAYGGAYEHNGRISMATGLPTVLGWAGHEHQWRGTLDEIEPRKADIEKMYRTRDDTERTALMDEYDVRYVVVGGVERRMFELSEADIARFERFMTPVFRSGEVTLFERR